MLASIAAAALIGTWVCTDPVYPNTRFVYRFSRKRGTVEAMNGSHEPFMRSFSYTLSYGYMVQRFDPSFNDPSNTYQFRVRLANGKLHIFGNARWVNGYWNPTSQASDEYCHRVH